MSDARNQISEIRCQIFICWKYHPLIRGFPPERDTRNTRSYLHIFSTSQLLTFSTSQLLTFYYLSFAASSLISVIYPLTSALCLLSSALCPLSSTF